MSIIEQLFPPKGDDFFNSDGEKAGGKSLENQDRRALDLIAPKLIQESRNCSIVHSLPRIPPKRNITREARCRAANCELPTHRYSQ
jgi:hypothetical protein